MRIVFLLQTHKDPAQIRRLATILQATSSNQDNIILVSHDAKQPPLSQHLLAGIENAYIIESVPTNRGDGSLLDSYFLAAQWLEDRKVEYDWLINLSGQDYPVQPVSALETMLATHITDCGTDGFIEHFDISSDNPAWGGRTMCNQYFYQYKRLQTKPLPRWQRALLKIPRAIVNNTQSRWRMNTSYGLMWGHHPRAKAFNGIDCYAGSYFMCLSHSAVLCLLNTTIYLGEGWPDDMTLLDYYRNTINAEESYIHTVLLNNEFIALTNRNLHYINWEGSRHGHPKLLGSSDLAQMIDIEKRYFFARKFDGNSPVLRKLDIHLTAQY